MVSRTKCLLCILGLCFFTSGCREQPQSVSQSGASIETHYAPKENLEAMDSGLIRSAHESIDICAFAFTDHELADALTSVAAHGVKVRLYLDQGQTRGELDREERRGGRSSGLDNEDDGVDRDSAGVLHRLASTPNIEVRIKRSRTLMHLKSYLIDGVVLRSGSANFSPTGEKRQDNDLLLTRNRESALRFKQNFEALWGRPDNEVISASRP